MHSDTIEMDDIFMRKAKFEGRKIIQKLNSKSLKNVMADVSSVISQDYENLHETLSGENMLYRCWIIEDLSIIT